MDRKQLVILTGPSCAGKSPLTKALGRMFPELVANLNELTLYNSRHPRPGEKDGVDYHFRSRAEIDALRDKEGFSVQEVRGDLQAVDAQELEQQLQHSSVFYEGNVFFAEKLIEMCDAPAVTAFLSPLNRDEIRELQTGGADLEEAIADMMRQKLVSRAHAMNRFLGLPDLEDIERRAKSAFREMQRAHKFEQVIPNHDGEDSDHWTGLPIPIGDARRSTRAFAQVLRGESHEIIEHWDRAVLGGEDEETQSA